MSMKITIIVGCRQSHFMLVGEEVCKTIADVREFCFRRFPEMKNDRKLRIFWNDQDGDEICIVTDGDYRSFTLATAENAKGGSRRLYVEEGKDEPKTKEKKVHPRKRQLLGTEKAPPSGAETAVLDVLEAAWKSSRPFGSASVVPPVHKTVVCDVCDRRIIGHRYRCLMCHDYDLCMFCESKFRHKEHIMLRIPRPLAGPQIHSHRILEQFEQQAALLEMAPEPERCGQKTADGTDVHTAACDEEHMLETRRQNVLNAHLFIRPAMLRRMSRYVDPANIGERQTERHPQPGRPDFNRTAAAAAADVRHTMQLATDAAKVASEVASTSWNTIRDCAGMFTRPIAVVNGATPKPASSAPANEQARTAAQLAASRVLEKCGDVGSLLEGAGLSKGSLYRYATSAVTPPPTPEAAGPNGSRAADGGEKASDREQPATVVEAAAEKDKERAGEENGGEKLQTDSVVAGGAGSAIKEHIDQAVENPDDGGASSDTSSASMLTDDDEDVLKGAAVPEDSITHPPAALPWILLNLPEVDGGEAGAKKAVAEQTGAAASTSSAPPPPSPSPVVEPSAIPSPPASEKATKTPPAAGTTSPVEGYSMRDRIFQQASGGSLNTAQHVNREPDSLADKLRQMVKTSIAQTMGPNASPDTPRTAAQTKQAARLLEQYMVAERDAMRRRQSLANGPLSGSSTASVGSSAAAEVEEKTTQTAPSAPAEAGAPTASSTPPPPAPATRANVRATARHGTGRVYSVRPLVNDAIHSMMAMGFSNADDHLTQLLEALDGDITGALDMLVVSHQRA